MACSYAMTYVSHLIHLVNTGAELSCASPSYSWGSKESNKNPRYSPKESSIQFVCNKKHGVSIADTCASMETPTLDMNHWIYCWEIVVYTTNMEPELDWTSYWLH